MVKISDSQFSHENLPANPPPARNNKKIILIVLGVVLLCCVCLAAAAALFGFSSLFSSSSIEAPFSSIIGEATPAGMTVRPTTTPPAAVPTATAVQPTSAGKGLGVSRAEMMDFFGSGGAFEFEEPFTSNGMELMMGYHTWLCLEGDCAAVTLLGPEKELLAVSAAVPTDPNDQGQTMTATALLMTLAQRFSSAASSVSTDILDYVLTAQVKPQEASKVFKDNGYVFTVAYDASTHIASLAIAP
ncbi:MAG: hypothetical protein IT308_09530 [Anaerolineaceae bacterium]|nr:hypothetical protein [Anaerolineaceae bacterium]